MVITTNAGLWRYQLGDTIVFTNTNPYRFMITGRTRQHINVFGEELMVHNVEAALSIACEKRMPISTSTRLRRSLWTPIAEPTNG